MKGLTIEAGVVKFSEVMEYAQRIGITDIDQQLIFYDMVRACDVERLVYIAEQRRQEAEDR